LYLATFQNFLGISKEFRKFSGSAIRCYSCKDYTASCTKQRDCSYDDACLTLIERGGMTYRKCLKYTECERSRLAQMFPSLTSQVSSFTFRCCNSDLCNSASSSAAGSVIGLLASVLVMWWCPLSAPRPPAVSLCNSLIDVSVWI
ncbi:CD59 glycoprotein-like, partial [Poeciliopsis prolifica]|uniref:CD59 glycoprotein-like n=1 Tax=Poeciliopsis prolifica TaxID=188132 RepID=UPI00241421F5